MASQTLQPSWSDRVKGIPSNTLQPDPSSSTDIEVTTDTANEELSVNDFPPLGGGDSKQVMESSQEMTDSQIEEKAAHLKGKSWADMFDDDDLDEMDEELMTKLKLTTEKEKEKEEDEEEEEEGNKTSKYLGGKHGTESSRWANAPDEPPRRNYYDNNRSNQYGTSYGRSPNYSNNNNYYNNNNNNNYSNNSYSNNNYNNNSYSNNNYSNNNYNNNNYNNNNSNTYKPRADTSFRRSDEEADKIYNELKNEIYGTPIPPPVDHSPEPTKFGYTDNSSKPQKWNDYASTASSPIPTRNNRWTNDRYQSERSTSPTSRKWVSDPSEQSNTSDNKSNSSWRNDRYNAYSGQSSPSNNNSRWKNDRYEDSTEPKTSSDGWRNYNNNLTPSYNDYDKNKGSYNTRNTNNNRRGVDDDDEKAFAQLKDEIYGTSTASTDENNRNNYSNRNHQNQRLSTWQKDENGQWVAADTPTPKRYEKSPKENDMTSSSVNSKWASDDPSSSANSQWASYNSSPRNNNREINKPTDSSMNKESNPNEDANNWIKSSSDATTTTTTTTTTPSSPDNNNNNNNEDVPTINPNSTAVPESKRNNTDNCESTSDMNKWVKVSQPVVASDNSQWKVFSEMNANVTKREKHPEPATSPDNSSQSTKVSDQTSTKDTSENSQWIKSAVTNATTTITKPTYTDAGVSKSTTNADNNQWNQVSDESLTKNPSDSVNNQWSESTITATTNDNQRVDPSTFTTTITDNSQGNKNDDSPHNNNQWTNDDSHNASSIPDNNEWKNNGEYANNFDQSMNRPFSPRSDSDQNTIYTPAPLTNKWTHDKFDNSIVENRSNASSPSLKNQGSPDPGANKWVQWAKKQA